MARSSSLVANSAKAKGEAQGEEFARRLIKQWGTDDLRGALVETDEGAESERRFGTSVK